MSGKIIKILLKVVVIVWLIEYLIDHFTSVRLDGFLIPIALLVSGLVLFKRWLPSLFNFMKRLLTWTLKATGNWLWQKREKKGGANVRQPRMRWRP